MKSSRPPTTTTFSHLTDLFRSISLPGERWKQAKGFSLNYYASDMGRLLTLTHHGGSHPAIMRPALDANGYYRTVMDRKTVKVHRVIAETWLENPLSLPCVNHLDTNRANNQVSNLEWCSIKYNAWYGTRHGAIKTPRHPRQDWLTREEREAIKEKLAMWKTTLPKDKNGKFAPRKGDPTMKELYVELCKEFPRLCRVTWKTMTVWLQCDRSRLASMRQSLTIPSVCEMHHTHIVSEENIVFPCTTVERRI